MQRSKLIALLKTFSKEDMKEFERFISSPYFSRGRNLKPLYNVLKKYYPEFDSIHFTVEKVFKKLYPKKKFEGKRSLHLLRVLVSEILILAEKFLVYNGFESGQYGYHFYSCLALSYGGKNLLDQTLKALEKGSEIIDSSEKAYDYNFNRLETDVLISSIYNHMNKPAAAARYSERNLLYIYAIIFDNFAKYLNVYYVNKNRHNIEGKGIELVNLFTGSFDEELFDKECLEDKFNTKELTLINYNIIKSRLDENNKECLSNAVKIFLKIFPELSHNNCWNVYILIFNRLFGRIRGDVYYLSEAIKLTDIIWSSGVYSPGKHLNILPASYNTVLSIKAALPGSKELRKFVSEYCGKLAKEYYEDIKNYSEAYIYFKEKSFKKCLAKLSLNDSLKGHFKINKNKLKLCCLYELCYWDDALSSIDSFEHYLRKNKEVSGVIKTENSGFLNGLKKLVKLRLGQTSEPDIELNKLIEMNRNSLFGFWFEDKFKEIFN